MLKWHLMDVSSDELKIIFSYIIWKKIERKFPIISYPFLVSYFNFLNSTPTTTTMMMMKTRWRREMKGAAWCVSERRSIDFNYDFFNFFFVELLIMKKGIFYCNFLCSHQNMKRKKKKIITCWGVTSNILLKRKEKVLLVK